MRVLEPYPGRARRGSPRAPRGEPFGFEKKSGCSNKEGGNDGNGSIISINDDLARSYPVALYSHSA